MVGADASRAVGLQTTRARAYDVRSRINSVADLEMTWITCRPVTLKDLPAVHAVLTETWHATYDPLYGAVRVGEITGQWHAIPNLERELARVSPGETAFMAGLWDGRVVATASARRLDEAGAQLDRLYVRPPYQGLGIGAALLDAVVEAVMPAGRIRLEVDPGNASAIKFYTHLGFEHVSKTSDCGGGGFGIAAHVYERLVVRQ
jgi:ribosomal protein S18 acetylase RimI-like enzyme